MTAHAASRKARFAAVWTITALSVTIACIVAAVLADRTAIRWDVTADRAHSLSARTSAILARLDPSTDSPVDATIVASLSEMDRAARDRLTDLTATINRASDGRARITLADAADPATATTIAELVARLARRDADEIARQRAAIADAAAALAALAADLDALAAPMRRLADNIPDAAAAQRWQGGIAALGPLATDLATAARDLPAFADAPASGTALPEPDAARAAIAPVLTRVTDGATSVAREAEALAASDASPAARDAAMQTQSVAAAIAAAASALPEPLARLAPCDALRVARTLERAEAMVVVGPSAVVIRPIDALFASITSDTGHAAFAGEVALASAIAAASESTRPTVVLVHAEKQPILTPTGEPTPALASVCGRTLADITARGWRLAEWSTVIDPLTPDRVKLGAGPGDPVVWFVLGAPGTATGDAIERTTNLAAGLRRLIDQDESLLITVLPSDLPALGETDPIADALAAFGITADTGRPLVTRAATPTGPSFTVDQTPDIAADHDIAGAIRGLPITMRLAVPMTVEHTGASPILTVPDSRDRWAESSWRILGTPRASIEPPSPDPARDGVAGPWTIALALQREAASARTTPQRTVIVGGALWYADAFTKAAFDVEGRRALRFPGNAQLLDASLAWLAGLDDMIPLAPDVRDVPRIAAIEPARLSAIRWALAAGVPAAALILGVSLHALRNRSGRRTRAATAPPPSR
jgi:hypothetical protein